MHFGDVFLSQERKRKKTKYTCIFRTTRRKSNKVGMSSYGSPSPSGCNFFYRNFFGISDPFTIGFFYWIMYVISPAFFPAKDRGTGNELVFTSTRIFGLIVRFESNLLFHLTKVDSYSWFFIFTRYVVFSHPDRQLSQR